MRRKCLLMIGWSFYVEDPIKCGALIDEQIGLLLKEKKFEEAAATAFFHGLDLKKSINVLMESNGMLLYLMKLRRAVKVNCGFTGWFGEFSAFIVLEDTLRICWI